MATISVLPARLMGTTRCLRATSRGISAMTSASTSNSARLTAGTPYWRERKRLRSSSDRAPLFTNASPRRSPDLRLASNAFWSCSGEISCSRTRSSPSRLMTPDHSGYQAQIFRLIRERVFPGGLGLRFGPWFSARVGGHGLGGGERGGPQGGRLWCRGRRRGRRRHCRFGGRGRDPGRGGCRGWLCVSGGGGRRRPAASRRGGRVRPRGRPGGVRRRRFADRRRRRGLQSHIADIADIAGSRRGRGQRRHDGLLCGLLAIRPGDGQGGGRRTAAAAAGPGAAVDVAWSRHRAVAFGSVFKSGLGFRARRGGGRQRSGSRELFSSALSPPNQHSHQQTSGEGQRDEAGQIHRGQLDVCRQQDGKGRRSGRIG